MRFGVSSSDGSTSVQCRRSLMTLPVIGLAVLVSGCQILPKQDPPPPAECRIDTELDLPPLQPDGTVVLEPEHQTEVLILLYETEQCQTALGLAAASGAASPRGETPGVAGPFGHLASLRV